MPINHHKKSTLASVVIYRPIFFLFFNTISKTFSMQVKPCKNLTKKKETTKKKIFTILESPTPRPLIYHALCEPHHRIVCIVAVQPQANECLNISCQQRPPCSRLCFAGTNV